MKIGIDCRLWDETGVGRYIRNLVLNLQEIDKENEYVLFALEKDVKDIKFKISNFKFQIIKCGIRWHTLKEQLSFPAILNRENLDLVHFPYFSVPIFYNRPFVVTIHDLIINHFSTGNASTLLSPVYNLKRLGYGFVISNAAKKSKKIIVPLNCVKEDLINTLGVPKDKIVVTPEGFDANIKKGKVSENVLKASRNPYFLYVGNAYPHKNLETLLKAFYLLNHKVKLILVGKEDYFYRKLESKKNNNVLFLHNVSDSDLFHLYSNSVAVVSASLMEGFGLVPLETLSAGAIPVVSDIPAFREVCSDLAIYFNPKDTQDIAEKLINALSLKPAQREGIRKNAESLLKKFSWSKMAKDTLQAYEDSVGL